MGFHWDIYNIYLSKLHHIIVSVIQQDMMTVLWQGNLSKKVEKVADPIAMEVVDVEVTLMGGLKLHFNLII